jgi:hypothetical protein
MDALARAHALLGLRVGCTASDLKRAYRRLSRQWHPDRHANDPVGQAEATRQMCVINDAVALVAKHLVDKSKAKAPPAKAESMVPPPSAGSEAQGWSLSKAQREAMVKAIGSESLVDMLLTWLDELWPFGLAAMFLWAPVYYHATRGEEVTGVSLVGVGVVRLVLKRLARRGGRRTRG